MIRKKVRCVVKIGLVALALLVTHVATCPLIFMAMARMSVPYPTSKYFALWDYITDNTALNKPLLKWCELFEVRDQFEMVHYVRVSIRKQQALQSGGARCENSAHGP